MRKDRILSDTQPCARCGIRTYAEFCLDCRAVDPKMTARGKTSREVARERAARNAAERDFQATMRRIAYGPPRPRRRVKVDA